MHGFSYWFVCVCIFQLQNEFYLRISHFSSRLIDKKYRSTGSSTYID